MELNHFFNSIKVKKQNIIMIVLIFMILSLVLTFAQSLKYSSRLRLLVVSNSQSAVTDPYSAAMSNEYLSNILTKVTYSSSFFEQVINSNFSVEETYFGDTTKKQEKTWNKTINVKTVGDSGIISITAYHKDRDQAERISKAVGSVLITQHSSYHGMGDNIRIKLLDEPIVSNFPVKPNIIVNFILSIVLGIVFSLAYIYLYTEKKLNNNFYSESIDNIPEIDYNEEKYDGIYSDNNDSFYQFNEVNEDLDNQEEEILSEEELIKKLNF